jgi:clan AA aspartic protease
MGHIRQDVEITGTKKATVRMLVDTGATFSVIPKALAGAIGVKPSRHSMRVTLADGRRVRCAAALVSYRIGRREAPGPILIGDVSLPLLGVETLEALGLAADPRRSRLVPTRSYTVRVPFPGYLTPT